MANSALLHIAKHTSKKQDLLNMYFQKTRFAEYGFPKNKICQKCRPTSKKQDLLNMHFQKTRFAKIMYFKKPRFAEYLAMALMGFRTDGSFYARARDFYENPLPLHPTHEHNPEGDA